MPTTVDVKNLKINKLTEAQYDTAVQGGVIGENELSILTDLDDAIQVSSLPIAAASELDKIYQYIGTTDANYTNGYFYKCIATGDPAVYSWTQTDVQPQASGLPDQTGQSGKFLTTDGTNASWSNKPLVNNATGNNSIASGPGANSAGAYSVAIGSFAHTDAYAGVAIGQGSSTLGSTSIAIGANTQCSGNKSVGIGGGGTATHAIQIGSTDNNYTTNSDANTLKVANANGNFELMSADGTIPKERLANVVSMPATMPQLTVDGWSSNTQTINVTGVTANNVVMVSPSPVFATEYAQCGILCTGQAAGTLTFTCTSVPTNDLTVNVVCF